MVTGSFNKIMPKGGSSGTKNIVNVRIIIKKQYACRPIINDFGWIILLSQNVTKAIYVSEKVSGEKSIGGINASNGSAIVFPILTSRIVIITLQYLNKKMYRITVKIT